MQERFLEQVGHLCTLSYNIHDEALDAGFLVDVVTKYKTRPHIRVAIAQPLADLPSAAIPVRSYPRLAPTLLDLARRCDERDIRIGFDCGFTLCMFSPEQVGELVLAGCRFKADCGPAIDVGTDLSVWPCFPLSTLCQGVHLADFPTYQALVDHFAKSYRRLYRVGVLDECVECKYRRREQCPGGCAAHTYRSFHP
jgi:hypothetical protein